MKDLFFWLQWKSSYRTLYVALLVLFFASIIAVFVAYTYGDIYTIGWDTTGEWKNVTLSLDVFQVNQFDLSHESPQFLLLKRYAAGDVTVHPWISYTFIGIVLLAFVCFLTVVSYVDLWLYIAGMAIFIFFIISMQTEQLGIFGLFNRAPAVLVIILFSGLTYYFNSFGKQINLFVRMLALAALTLLFLALIVFGSHVEVPLLYAANYAIAIPILICVIFMLIVSYDFLQFLVIVTSYGKSKFKASGNSIWNFIIIGTLYLTNLFLIFFQPDFIKDMGIVLIQPLVVLVISSILGIWLFGMKEEVSSVLPFKPLGAILYLALGIISFSVIALGYSTANDALITALETSALYIQIGMGLGIFIYVITNFWNKYKERAEVYKHFYIAYQVPFFVGRGLGWAIIMYFIFASNRFVVKSGKAAYYNNVGDIYLYTGQDALAESFFKESYSYEFQNQRCNYTLGSFYESRDDKANAFKYYENSLAKKPSVAAFVSLSNFYITNKQFFPAIFMLQDGLKSYPQDPYLLNNLGYLYTQFNSSDSAAYFFNKAALHADDDVAMANMLSYFSAAGKFEECAAIMKNEKSSPSLMYLANKIGIATLQSKTSEIALPKSILTDSALTADSYTLLYNYTINKLSIQDSVLERTLHQLSEKPQNEFYKSNLLFAKALHLYYSNTNIPEALILLQDLVAVDNTPLYTITLADWQLKAGLYQEAYERYNTILINSDQHIVAKKCIAAMEYGNSGSVKDVIVELAKSQTPEVAYIGSTLKAALAQPSLTAYDTLSPQQKVQCLHYHTISAPEYIIFKNTITDQAQSVQLDIEQIQQLTGRRDYIHAMLLWNALNKTSEATANTIAEGNLQYLNILAGLHQWDSLDAQLKTTTLLDKDLGYIDYFHARVLQEGRDSLAAKPYYERALTRIGYVPQVQIDYANYITETEGEIAAVEKLVAAKQIITYSKPLNMLYLETCLRMGLFKSAESELNAMLPTLTAAEIASIKQQFYSYPIAE